MASVSESWRDKGRQERCLTGQVRSGTAVVADVAFAEQT